MHGRKQDSVASFRVRQVQQDNLQGVRHKVKDSTDWTGVETMWFLSGSLHCTTSWAHRASVRKFY